MGRIGMGEILAILAVILLIFGSTKLPELARAVGKSVVELKAGLKGSGGSEDSSAANTEPEK